MRKERLGTDGPRSRDEGEEERREHERNRRLKSERERLLRRQLARLRSAGSEDELEDGLAAGA